MLTKRAGRSHLMIATTLLAAGCADVGEDASSADDAALASENGLSFNGLSFNGLSFNGLSFNGLSFNGLSFNGLSFNGLSFNGLSFNGLSSGGLSSTNGLMTTPGGREFVKYMTKVAYPAGHSLTKQDQYGTSYTFNGSLGIAPEAELGTCDVACQERISGALLAHVNNSGLHVGIWLVGPDTAVGWGTSTDYPYMEAAYFGNVFAPNMPSEYCAGKDMASGNVKGRLGSPWGNNSSVLASPYGWQYDSASGTNAPAYCSVGCAPQSEGFSQCTDTSRTWTHPVTVYRNFEPTQLYKICNRQSGKCLGTAGGSITDGAAIEQRTFTSAAGQTWQILQVSPGNYKIINKTSGMALAVSGTSVVQKPYTGASSQIVPIAYFADQPGFANLKMASNPTAVFAPAGLSVSDGALLQATAAYGTTIDAAKWAFTAVSLATFDPGRTYRLAPQSVPTMAVEVAYGSTTNGTMVQQYQWWGADQQKLFIRDAGGGNVKLAMKINANKCLGPVGNATTAGAALEVQDCNGSYFQSWITAETSAGSGVIVFKNAAAPTLCMDAGIGNPANGARIQLYLCNSGNSQKFALTAAP